MVGLGTMTLALLAVGVASCEARAIGDAIERRDLALLDRGYVVTYTDYAGTGVAGTDSYLIGATQGNNVLDAVRAARDIPSAPPASTSPTSSPPRPSP